MPFDYKLALVLIFVGISNRLLSENRNWIFGYRTSWSMKSHRHYSFANKIGGMGTFIFGLFYLSVLLYGDDYLNFNLEGLPKRLVILTYFTSLVVVIEIGLRRKFPNEKTRE